MASVHLQKLSKQFGGATAVDHIDLEIEDGEFMVLVGPSGCGKTTTLRLIAGLEEATSGEIRIGGRNVKGVEPKDRNVAMVFQSYALYPHMSVRQNLAFGLKMRNVGSAEIERKVNEVAQALGLQDLLKRTPQELSGGQQQRVALGRAILREPDLFLLDEPLSNLDSQLRVAMRTELVRLHRRLKRTMIYVTHDQVEAMMMGTRLTVMNQGKIQQVGTPLDVYQNPKNRFVGEFMGWPAMEFLPGIVEIASGQGHLVVMGYKVPLEQIETKLGKKWDGVHGERVDVGIRPADWRIGASEQETGGLCLEGEIDIVQSLGAQTLLGVVSQGATLSVLTDAKRWRQGESIRLSANVDVMHLFDMKTGERLGS